MTEPTVIYEDNDVLVLDKPAGLTVHPDNYSTGPFLTDWLIAHYPNLKEAGEDRVRPGIVHRLDKDTSGVMIVAKTPVAREQLKAEFHRQAAEKVYWALTVGEFKGGVGTVGEIDWPIGRSRRDPRVRVASAKAAGRLRPAVTNYKVLHQGGGYAWLELKPQSGRTHQLRAHLKALQHPVACDRLYGTAGYCLAGLKRQALHAASLKLLLPSGVEREFSAPLPADLTAVLAALDFPC